MSALLPQIQQLIAQGKVRVSRHADRRLVQHDISLQEILAGIRNAAVVEEYPEYPVGICVLVLQYDSARRPVHALWGLRQNTTEPAVLITAYRPDPAQWSANFLLRKP